MFNELSGLHAKQSEHYNHDNAATEHGPRGNYLAQQSNRLCEKVMSSKSIKRTSQEIMLWPLLRQHVTHCLFFLLRG